MIKTIIITTLFYSSLIKADEDSSVKLIILGIAQDAGYPQLNCYKPHCMSAWKDADLKKFATSLGLIDSQNKKKYLFEATPDIREQMYNLHTLAPDSQYTLDGVFLTHAHIGHYTGLMHFGREAAGTSGVKVYAMPQMMSFLKKNGPWSQLVELKNIILKSINHQNKISLTENIAIIPLLVPHRDEYSETVGYKIFGPTKSVLFIPDINKWKMWDLDITEEIKKVDYALLDATFYKNGEIPNRNMIDIPHPFVEESMQLFSKLSKQDKNKIIFIHFNHTNPLIDYNSDSTKFVLAQGYQVAKEGLMIDL
jgi:pyrroloquinoline quinone biosynthesis protein B